MAKTSSKASKKTTLETEEVESSKKETKKAKAPAKKATTKKAATKKTTSSKKKQEKVAKEQVESKTTEETKKAAAQVAAEEILEEELEEDLLEDDSIEPDLSKPDKTTEDDSVEADASLSDDELLEGIPQEELKAAAEITVPRVSSKTKTARTRKYNSDNSVAMLTGDPVRMYLKEIGKVSLAHGGRRGRPRHEDRGRCRGYGTARCVGRRGRCAARASRTQAPFPYRAGRSGCKAAAHRSELTFGGLHREALCGSWHAVLGPYPGR